MPFFSALMIVVSIKASLSFCEVEGSGIDRDVVIVSDEPAIVVVKEEFLPLATGVEDPSCALINFGAGR